MFILEPGSISYLWGDTSNILAENVSMFFCVSIPSNPCAGHGGVLKVARSLPFNDRHMRLMFAPDIVTDVSWQQFRFAAQVFFAQARE